MLVPKNRIFFSGAFSNTNSPFAEERTNPYFPAGASREAEKSSGDPLTIVLEKRNGFQFRSCRITTGRFAAGGKKIR